MLSSRAAISILVVMTLVGAPEAKAAEVARQPQRTLVQRSLRPLQFARAVRLFHQWRLKTPRANRIYLDKLGADLKTRVLANGLKLSALLGVAGTGGVAKAVHEYVTQAASLDQLAGTGSVSAALIVGSIVLAHQVLRRMGDVRRETLADLMTEYDPHDLFHTPIPAKIFPSLTKAGHYAAVEKALERGGHVDPSALEGLSLEAFSPKARKAILKQAQKRHEDASAAAQKAPAP